ncbi:hypothetical protein VPH35_044322 [Triticum aestivum]|uniref:Uncharacterized protein n=1 Tax=Triticum urartu TaxID=4572 RepID=A0A8R7TUV1_TRIUA
MEKNLSKLLGVHGSKIKHGLHNPHRAPERYVLFSCTMNLRRFSRETSYHGPARSRHGSDNINPSGGRDRESVRERGWSGGCTSVSSRPVARADGAVAAHMRSWRCRVSIACYIMDLQ